MIIQDNAVLVQNVTCLYEGISTPDDEGKYSLSFALPQNAPEVAELQNLVNNAVATMPSWGGRLKGRNPLENTVDVGKYGAEFQGMLRINTGTKFSVGVVDQNIQNVNPMAVPQYVYAGAKINVIIKSAYAYEAAGNSGVKFNIEGVMVVDNTLPKLAGGGMDLASAFGQALGGQSQPQPQPQQQAAPTPQPQAAPEPQAAKVYVHTATDFTKDQYIAVGHTEDTLVAQGKGHWQEATPAPAQPSGPAAPTGPAGVQPHPDILNQPGVVKQ